MTTHVFTSPLGPSSSHVLQQSHTYYNKFVRLKAYCHIIKLNE